MPCGAESPCFGLPQESPHLSCTLSVFPKLLSLVASHLWNTEEDNTMVCNPPHQSCTDESLPVVSPSIHQNRHVCGDFSSRVHNDVAK